MTYHENKLFGKRVSFRKYKEDLLNGQNCSADNFNIIGSIIEVYEPNENSEGYYQIRTENTKKPQLLFVLKEDCTFM